jgi:DNA-binding IclR family transcriptional regulator
MNHGGGASALFLDSQIQAAYSQKTRMLFLYIETESIMGDDVRAFTPTDRLLQLLIELVREGRPMQAKELAQRVEQPLSTAYRHLETLKAWGFVADSGRSEGVALGPTCMLIARYFDRPEHLLSIARPAMHELVLATEESVGLMVAIGREAVCLEMIESSQPLRCSFAPGRSQPLARGASAKALLAFMSEGRRAAVVEANLGEPHARQALLDELELIRKRGFAESEGEVDAAIWGASVPILTASGRLEAVLTLMAPTDRVRPRRDRLIALTRRAAEGISMSLRGDVAGSLTSGPELEEAAQ